MAHPAPGSRSDRAPSPQASSDKGPRYRAYSLKDIESLPQLDAVPRDVRDAMRVVGSVLPVKTNNYVVEQLIDWNAPLTDPIFLLNFPQREMLLPHHFERVQRAMQEERSPEELKAVIHGVRMELNPHPAGQLEHNVPTLADGTVLSGLQHKYQDTVLFFPSQAQTCHAYCSFCFRWPQFVGMDEFKFATKETEGLVRYLHEHPEVTDVLFTGGDPMVMKSRVLRAYLEPLLASRPESLRSIRIGSKSLSYWPYKYTSEPDSDDLLRLFEQVVASGIHLSFMAHFNHVRELSTPAVERAIARIRSTGVQIRTQSPLLEHINADAEQWSEMWRRQVALGCIPYYMFVVRDTGAQHYFGVPLVRAQEIFRTAYRNVSGLARTVRGPSMSAGPGKIQMLGTTELGNEQFLVLQFLRGRNPEWVRRPFLAQYDEKAIWLDELKPASGDRFFFEDELDQLLADKRTHRERVSGSREVGPP